MNPSDESFSIERAEEIFFTMLEIAQSDRESFLEQACGTEPALKQTVTSMLEDLEKASDFFERTAQQLTLPDDLNEYEELSIGAQIGSYRILKVLGEGGSSKVYEAEQLEPITRKVALKILKLGMDTRSLIQRFETERQTLAKLEHPNISQVYDAGATASGRPYFVMELVHGIPITDYCNKFQLSIDNRLQLMLKVFSALQHAHNKGIIHRDIKPSNILISEIDGVAIPKLIDFGIAKMTDTPASEGRTLLGQPIGTPAYMSPEQFDGTWNLDTRSDLYSMGVVLYELLAGKPPFDNEELVNLGFEEMRRRIKFETPGYPLNPGLSRMTKRSELDWIVMKGIEKDRERRYSTVHAFSEDIENYLRNDPVKAHPPSRIYKLQKLILRNRLAAGLVVVTMLSTTIGFSVSTLLFIRARTAEIEQTRLKEAAEERAHITKAAILIMQNKNEEADQEIRKMGGLITQPSLEATNVFRTLAIWSSARGDWKTSADRWLAMSRVNRFDESDMTEKVTENLLPISPILVMTGDFKRYNEFREFLLDRLENTTYPFAAEHLLKLCLLTPDASRFLPRLQHAATIAENSLLADMSFPPSERMEAWRCVALALWNLRNDKPVDAIAWCDRSLLLDDWEKSRIMQTYLIRAIARELCGEHSEAIQDFETARIPVGIYTQDPVDQARFGHFHDWLNASILMQEFERLSDHH